jgi:hypothetical protein
LGTFPDGAVRISFGFFNREDEAYSAAKAVAEITRTAL